MELNEFRTRYCAELIKRTGITTKRAKESFDGFSDADIADMLALGDPEGAAIEELSYWDEGCCYGIMGGVRWV